MSNHLADTDLGAMFGIDLDGSIATDIDVATLLCGKCHGRGNFIAWSGRVVGKCFTCNGSGLARATTSQTDTAIVNPVDVQAIAVAFAAAREHGIKTPKLRLGRFIFSRAPDHGVNKGAIYVKIVEGATYLGKIANGAFRPTLACNSVLTTEVIDIASKPHQAAKAYGKRTGNCSCCGRTLTNGISIDLGIGPICRGRFGWG